MLPVVVPTRFKKAQAMPSVLMGVLLLGLLIVATIAIET